ncbi:RNA polymerase sigma factor [Metabacillus halosaccharovorans]|uniref:RNA polymerase sigma factor n=3 Tax=Metabacillus halosaccharovorans TaxID=930124 RepID=UPI00203C59D3|nr:sigma factor [Metabacillus halosaccharovorans]MCM3439755.1 hypothetical protein [Metabacillus halosaccharovorans]
MDEKSLIEKSKQGDNNAFNLLLKPYVIQAQQTSYLLLHDYALAQDAVQEALIQTHSSLNRFDPNKAAFKTWFNRIVINCSLNQKRKRKFTFQLENDYGVNDCPEKNSFLKKTNGGLAPQNGITVVGKIKEVKVVRVNITEYNDKELMRFEM